MRITTTRIFKAAIAGIGALGLISIAGTAFAAGPSGTEQATVSVPSSLTLTLAHTSFSFGSGSGTLASPDEQFTVISNDVTGYNVEGSAEAFSDGGPSLIPSGALGSSATLGPAAPIISTFMNDGTAGGYSSAINIAQETGPSAPTGDTWDEFYSLAVPANQPAGSYSASIMLTAVGQ